MLQFPRFRTFSCLAAIALLLGLGACNSGSKSSPSNAPTGFAVSATDSGATITFNQEPGLDYWLFYAAAPAITVDNFNTFPQSHVNKSITSPFTVGGLTNGTTYAFVMNSTRQGSPAGPATVSKAVTPAPAGSVWPPPQTPTLPVGNTNLNAVIFGAGLDVIAGEGGKIFTSPDSAAWTLSDSTTPQEIKALALNPTSGTLVAVSAGGTILTSANAMTWSKASGVPAVGRLNGVASSGSLYVAVGDGGTILTSPDGTTSWAPVPSSPTGENLNAVAYLNATTFVAVGAKGTVVTSTDGSKWSAPQKSNTVEELFGVAFGNSLYVAVGAEGTIISSADAADWKVEGGIPTMDLYAVAIGTQVVAVGEGGTIVYGSPGNFQTTVSGTNSLRSVYYALGLIAVGDAGTITISK